VTRSPVVVFMLKEFWRMGEKRIIREKEMFNSDREG